LFGSKGIFAKQFSPYEGGYLFYPGRKSGGKLISESEYQQLLENWLADTGTVGIIKNTAIVAFFVGLGVTATLFLDVGEWIRNASSWSGAAIVSARILWSSFAPHRFVKGRPDATPPRSRAALGQYTRSMMPWPIVIPFFILSTALFLALLFPPPRTVGGWLWLIGSGAVSASYARIAVRKFSDRRG
jgi:hypothetical protein